MENFKYKELEDKYIPKEAREISDRNKKEAQKSFQETMKSITDNPESGSEAINKYMEDHMKRQEGLRNDLHKAFDDHREVLDKKVIDNKDKRETPISADEQVMIDKFNNLIEELKLIPRYKILKRRNKLKEVRGIYLDLLKFRSGDNN